MTELRTNIPVGMTRVIGEDRFSQENFMVGDFKEVNEAFQKADDKNRSRSRSQDSAYFVYNDKGVLIRGTEAVDAETNGLGVRHIQS